VRTILFATSNAGKLVEAKRCVSEAAGIRLIGVNDLCEHWLTFGLIGNPGTAPDPEENGATYKENAIIKAKAYCEWSGLPTIADDAGLEVKALDGAPGLYSARYAGSNASMEDNRALLLEQMLNVNDRSARFLCTLAFVKPEQLHLDQEIIIADGYLDGAIANHEISGGEIGGGGFGYDNLFLYENTGKTLAELKTETTSSATFVDTHRSRAFRELFRAL
jgi:XTP/dITP diphosphohydrolase